MSTLPRPEADGLIQAPPEAPESPRRPGLSPEAIQAIADMWTEILLRDLERRPPLTDPEPLPPAVPLRG